jgi:cellulose synthase (UDP-forming)
MRALLIRALVTLTLLTGTTYLTWRWVYSVNWHNWWIAVPLVLAETYSLIDAYLSGLTMWRIKERGEPPAPEPDATVDVFITTYNEPVDMVITTARAAKQIAWPHHTWILDDGNRDQMRATAAELGVGYLTRSQDWTDRPRHAKAGNLNNALFQTSGEFMLILDADQIPGPTILHRTLGYFTDPKVALVQTPQWFSNVTDADEFGSQAPLFYGPIQQGKDGWDAAFFCGSNAVLRREALMQLGIVGYVREVHDAVRDILGTSSRILARTARTAAKYGPAPHEAVTEVRAAAQTALADLRAGAVVGEVTYTFQRKLAEATRRLVAADFASINADLAAISALQMPAGTPPPTRAAPTGESATGGDEVIDAGPIGYDTELGALVVNDDALAQLATRDYSPLAALEQVASLMLAVDVDRSHEAQPLMPLATVSVTEDMATALRLHRLGWSSVYHHEVLAAGLAPEDLNTMLAQRLRWAQGTLQVLLKENPLTQRGLKLGQRLMYFATMWSYLSGFAALAFFAAPVAYLCFGVLPVNAYGLSFVSFFAPYMIANQLLFVVVGYGVKTWRGQQYSLALFPLWIRACVTVLANVYLGRPLGFVVTPKDRQATGGIPWRLIRAQVAVTAVLVLASVVGGIRLWTGASTSTIGTWVNLTWVAYDLLVLSVIFKAAAYRAPQPEKELIP